jgi:hypothetical protein
MPNKKKKSSGKQKQSTQAGGSSSNAPQESSTPSNTHSETPTPNTTVPPQSSKTSTGRRFTCLRFPADGSPPGLVEGKMSTDQFSPKYGFVTEPDLSELWEGDCSKLKMQRLVVVKMDPPEINTEYWSFYSIDPNLPVNKSLLSFPKVKSAISKSTATGGRFEDRLFYRGDYFLVRLEDETDKTNFEARGQSIHPSLIPPLRGIIERHITGNWEDKFLERQAKSDAYFDRVGRREKDFKEKLMSQLYVHEITIVHIKKQ